MENNRLYTLEFARFEGKVKKSWWIFDKRDISNIKMLLTSLEVSEGITLDKKAISRFLTYGATYRCRYSVGGNKKVQVWIKPA